MDLTVRKQRGIVVEYAGQGVVLDPTGNNREDRPVFVTHAHGDHSAAFKDPEATVYATEETYHLIQAFGRKKIASLRPVAVGDCVKFDDLEVRVHNAGHVLGSVQYEVNTPEGTVLYTGDLQLEETYTTDPAKPVSCDLLVIETTFGAPMFNFPKRKDLSLEMIRWSVMEALPQGLIPAFKTDSIGNAQEIISIYNQMTSLPVVTAKSATLVSDIYAKYGYNLDYVDARSPEGQELIEDGKCVLITPKGSKLLVPNLDVALASGWATIMGKKRRAFPLSDHADYKALLGFIRRCKPKRVLTVHGGSMTRDFHKHVKRVLGIDAKPLTGVEETIQGSLVSGESRIRACSSQILRTIRIPGFVYTPSWLVKEMARRGFTRTETENSIGFLIEKGVLAEGDEGVRLV